MKPGTPAGYAQRGHTMNRSNISTIVRNTKAKAATVGAGLLTAAGMASAQVDTASITAEIDAAKSAGMVVLGGMILAGLAFKAWKLLKKA